MPSSLGPVYRFARLKKPLEGIRGNRALSVSAAVGLALVLSGCELITTFAGGPGQGPSTAVSMAPVGVFASGGNVYVTDAGDANGSGNSVVREISSSGNASLLAGVGPAGYLGNGAPADVSEVNNPDDVAVDSAGDVFIADTTNNVVRMIPATTATYFGVAMTAADIYTIAGNGTAGNTGAGGAATSAELNSPQGIAVDSKGNVIIADSQNFEIKVVAATTGTFYGKSMTAGDIYVVAGNGTAGYSGDNGVGTSAELGGSLTAILDLISALSVTEDTSGNIVIADAGNDRIRVVAGSTAKFYGKSMTAGDIYTVAGDGTSGTTGNGAAATSAEIGDTTAALDNGTTFNLNVGVDSHGNVLISDAGNNEIRVVCETSGTYYGKSMTSGDIYLVAGTGTLGYSGDNVSAANAELNGPLGVSADTNGNLIFADASNNRVRVVPTTSGTYYGVAMTAGNIYTMGGNGYPQYSGNGNISDYAELDGPTDVAADANNNMIIADNYNFVIRVAAEASGTFYGQSMTIGDMYTIAGTGTQGYSGDGGPGIDAELNGAEYVAVDQAGNVVIGDSQNSRIRVLAEKSGTFYGVSMTAGDIYTVAGNGTAGYEGDGGPATSAEVEGSLGVYVDSSGNILFCDSYDNRVRIIAGSTGTYYGQSMTEGYVYTIAGSGGPGYGTGSTANATDGSGGPANQANLSSPQGVTTDSYGNVIIADTGGDRIWVVAESTGTFYGMAMTQGDAYVIAGNRVAGYVGDQGPASASELNSPSDVTVDSDGNVIIADTGNNVIRIIPATTGTFYSLELNAGDIYTMAGTGVAGFSGEDQFPTAADLDGPEGVSMNSAGGVLIADTGNNRIREVHFTGSTNTTAG